MGNHEGTGGPSRVLQVSKRNAAYQEFEALKKNRTKRTRSGLIMVEGVAPINVLIGSGWAVKAVLRASVSRLSGWAKTVIHEARPEILYSLAPDLMAELSDKDDPSELILIAEPDAQDLSQLETVPGGMVLLADRPGNPGNLGSLIRSAHAFGAGGVVISGHGTDPFDPRAIRASLGAVFAIPIASSSSKTELTTWLDACRATVPEVQVIGTSAKAEMAPHTVDLTGAVVLVAGNETYGMSDFLRNAVDLSIRIPTTGVVSSLNLSCAVTAVLYEASRQRGFSYACTASGKRKEEP